MTVAYAMDMRVVVPREPADVNIPTASETLRLWHESLSHQDKRHVLKLLERVEINISMAETGDFFEGCVLGKALWKPFIPRSVQTQEIGELIHADINVPMSVKSLQGEKYYLCFNDDYSKYRRVSFMKQKKK
jgi:hypothetical protein